MEPFRISNFIMQGGDQEVLHETDTLEEMMVYVKKIQKEVDYVEKDETADVEGIYVLIKKITFNKGGPTITGIDINTKI
jgi:hypothetical protein